MCSTWFDSFTALGLGVHEPGGLRGQPKTDWKIRWGLMEKDEPEGDSPAWYSWESPPFDPKLKQQ